MVTIAKEDGRYSDAPSSHLDDRTRVKQLLYRSKQRGWLELDIIMGTWAQQHLHTLNSQEIQQVDKT